MTAETFMVFLDVFAFAWGAIWGSFLNVVIYRLPAGKSLVKPPSHCPKCGTTLAWYDNIPILGWVILRGRCRYCKVPIPIRYPMVELLTALLSLALWAHVAHGRLIIPWETTDVLIGVLMSFFLYFYFIALLICIAFIDLDLAIIPHELTILGMVLGIVAAFILPGEGPFEDLWPGVAWLDALIGLGVGTGVIWLIIKGYALVRGVEGMGWGDFMLMGMVGAWAGWRGVIIVLLASSVQGLVAALGHALYLKITGKGRESSGFFIGDVEAIDGERSPFARDQGEGAAEVEGEVEGDEGEAEAPGFSQAAVPFGPFIALAALEYLLIGRWCVPWLLGLAGVNTGVGL